MHLPLHPEAVIELNAAVAWIERQRGGFGSLLSDVVARTWWSSRSHIPAVLSDTGEGAYLEPIGAVGEFECFRCGLPAPAMPSGSDGWLSRIHTRG